MPPSTSRDRKNPKRVIKKYPNRRLYDTDTSSYVTLSEIKQFVLDNESCEVVDAKTGEDLTRSILLQIILEEEANGAPMFTAAVLASIIRFYGHAMHGLMGGYLEKNMQSLMDMQAKFGEQAGALTPEMWAKYLNIPAPLMQGLANNAVLQQLQEQMQKQTDQFLGTFGLKR
ncbi:MAG: polyhydroxyalkanoate synthesis repressor PhaR [Rhodoferax sp.]|nr:polyhydroxyalkanoate synthesis repressor PhaR [Rhodoferax sp.]